jgi:glutamine cyclotransferase
MMGWPLVQIIPLIMIVKEMKISGLPGLLLLLSACTNNDSNGNDTTLPTENASVINYTVVKTYPHDTTSFTEGLLIHEGQLYESTGSPENMPQTRSLFGIVDTNTGKIIKKVELDRDKYFGEGICFLKGKLYQLTYQNKIGFIYDATTFAPLGNFTFPGSEGWGMTTDGTSLIMSEGTNTLYYVDPLDFKTTKTLQVTNNNNAVTYLNELEYINDFIYANVYTTNTIVKIDPVSGQVKATLDLSPLVTEVKSRYPDSMEMNGIAYDPASGKIYVTGKMWPTLYEIQFPH